MQKSHVTKRDMAFFIPVPIASTYPTQNPNSILCYPITPSLPIFAA